MKSPLDKRQIGQLPPPDAAALAHSDACADLLRADIVAAGGWIPFSHFMARALYAPGLGYYAAGARKFGAAGDFITAPEISPLFGKCIARSIADTIRRTGGEVLELGPGSGRLAVDILQELARIDALPSRYRLLEVSADLIERQRATLSALPPEWASRVEWIDTLPGTFDGAIIANEVLDVVPVHLVHFHSGWIFERGVALQDRTFVWQDVPALPDDVNRMVPAIQRASGGVPEGYLTEAAPAVPALVRSLMQSLRRGVLLLVDYGFRAAEYYHPDRRTGTLMCHYRHFAHTDPFLFPGLQDITAHVDFTAVAEAARAEEAELIGFTSQAQFLLRAGITDMLAEVDPADAANYLPLTNQAQRLLSPAEMGEFFKVIGFSRGGESIAALADARPLPL